ncbi:MAG: hypothetical protein JO089_02195 [Alphaproteobacteria bacterium]|nr:hypothetical protein [Alphaproteobacteria bacterium]
MKTIFISALAGMAALSAPALAQTASQDNADMQADVNAIHKDNAALNKQENGLAQDRTAKAMDKATGNYGAQAMDSIAIGVDQTAIAEKKTEKGVDRKILQQDKKDVNDARAKGEGYPVDTQ